jgi:carboxypeptidase PM20D1
MAIRSKARARALLRRIALAAILLFLALACVVVFRTLALAPARGSPLHEEARLRVGDPERAMAAAEKLSAMIQIPTVARDGEPPAAAEFRALHEFLERAYPLVHGRLSREVVGEHSLLFEWRGADAGAPGERGEAGRGNPGLAPVLLMAHADVVPVDPAAGEWTYPPFSGAIADGYVWGRGAMDDKGSLIAILEAVESLIAGGFVPRRTVYLAFGHDEETGGGGGHLAVARLLAGRGVRLEWVLDEGLVITDGVMPGVRAPVALVGVAEKGYVTLEIAATGEGGHSSMPPRETAAGIVAAAVVRLERDPFPARLDAAERLFDAIAPEMPFGMRAIFANLWLFAPLIERQLSRKPSTSALIRTTTAVTMLEASPKENVLPARARAVANFRIIPGETIASVAERVKRTIDDPRVEVRPIGAFGAEPSRPSSTESSGYRAIEVAIRAVLPQAVVAPSLVIPATDSRHYAGIAKDIYRFIPIVVGPADLKRFHGVDERISIADLERCVRFYRALLESEAGGG